MKTSTLFVLGLVLGAATVFGIRATTQASDSTGPSSHANHERAAKAGHKAHESLAHGGHGAPENGDEVAPAPAAAPDPAPAPAPNATSHAPSTHQEQDKLPENKVCPVMGNDVDPDVFVDYKGRRIGFCCPGCDTLFLKNPAKYLKIIDKEIANRAGDTK